MMGDAKSSEDCGTSTLSVEEGGNTADCNGHSSPDSGVNDLSYERCGSSGGEPTNGDRISPTSKRVEHRITVPADEKIRIQLGDTVRQVSGPANIAMVATNGTSAHLPIQAPPGHVVQRIVDENGVVTRYILHAQHPNMPLNQGPMYPTYPGTGSPSMSMSAGGGNHPRQQYSYNGSNGSQGQQGSYAPSNSQQSFPAGYHPQYHHHLMHQMMVPNGSANGHGGEERAQQRSNHTRHREKMSHTHRHKTPDIMLPHCYTHGHSARMSANGSSPRGCDRPLDTCSSSTDSHDTTEDEKRLLCERLSAINPPRVEVESRRAVVHITAPNIPENLIPLDQPINTDVQFQLQYLTDGTYTTLYNGDATTIKMQDLKPATQHYIKLRAMLDDVKGNFTEPFVFETLSAQPDVPLPPKLSSKSKAFISLKWNAVADNGSRILHYILEYSQGEQRTFNQCYKGLKKEFKLNKLQPSHCYTFRLSAVNDVGPSGFSKELSVFTNGLAPEQPDPPRLSEATINSLLLTWIKRPGVDKEFVLQKEEEDTGHGFLPAYTGPEVSYKVDRLCKSTTYRFRLLASNDDGKSSWSQVVVYRTNADVPGTACKLSVKGKVLSSMFKLSWEAPKENGGVAVSAYTAQLDAGHGYQSVYEGGACECSCVNLLPGHTYRARVAARNSVGVGLWCEPVHVTTKPACPGRCLTPWLLGKPRAHTLHLKWACPVNTGGSSVKSYVVQLVMMDNTTREVYRGRGTECTVAGLSPGRSYLLQVKAANEAGEGEWSEPLEVISGAGHPEPPLAPSCQVKSAHCVHVSWHAPCNNGAKISEYRLDCLHPNQQDYSNVYSGPDLQYEVKGLQSFSTYTFRVQAVNSSGPSHHSETCTVTTLASSPGVVHHVRPTASASSIALTWAAPDDNGNEVTHYNVEYGKHLIKPVTDVQERQCVLDQLDPDTTYRIRVQAVNGVGAGTFSSQVKVTTGSLPPSPPCLECVGSTWNSVRLKWSEVEKCDQYTVLMYRGQTVSQCVYQGPLQHHRVTKLHEHTDYQFTVSARNSAGEGEESSPLLITTARTPPHSLKAPAVEAVGEEGCEVSWQIAKHFPGDSILYRLQLSSQSSPSDWRQVLETDSTHYSLSSLVPGSSYSLRVCAVRVCSTQESIVGAYSPSVTFKTLKRQPVVEEVKVTEAARPSAIKAMVHSVMDKLRLEEESQYVIKILLFMFVVSIVLAVVMANYI